MNYLLQHRRIIFPLFITVCLVSVFASVHMAVAWTGPSQAVPGGDAPTPINIGSASQVKAGSFWADTIGTSVSFCISTACVSSWPTSPWILAGTALYYNGGKVGIGTASPVATLDINGVARLTIQGAAPATCSAALKGSIAMTANTRLCVCNGTSWVFDYNGAACAWGGGDTTPPTVSITAPSNGATVSGTTAVSATASDSVGVVGVQFKLDNDTTLLGAEDTTAPYGISWNTTSTSNGAHGIFAVARDAAGNTTTSAAVNVTVNNVVPGSQNYTTAGSYNFTVPTYNTMTVEVWGGGGGGCGDGNVYTMQVSGNNSTFDSMIAYGGKACGGGNPGSSVTGGGASGGDINLTGGAGESNSCNTGSNGFGGASPNGGAGGWGAGCANAWGGDGGAPGGGGGGSNDAYLGGGAGGSGAGYSKKTYSAGALTPGSTISGTVGAGGAGGSGGSGTGGNGGDGQVYITWN